MTCNLQARGGVVQIENGRILTRIPVDKRVIGNSGSLIELVIKICGCDAAVAFYNNIHKLGINVVDHMGLTYGYRQSIMPAIIALPFNKILEQHIDKLKSEATGNHHSVISRLKGEVYRLLGDEFESLPAEVKYLIGSGAAGSLASLIPIGLYGGQKTIGNKSLILNPAGSQWVAANCDVHALQGFVKSNYLDGTGVMEYYVSAMAARQGIVDTYTKTATSGYMARRLINAFENIRIDKYGLVTNDARHIIAFAHGQYGCDDRLIYDGGPLFCKYFNGPHEVNDTIGIAKMAKEVGLSTHFTNQLVHYIQKTGISHDERRELKHSIMQIIADHKWPVHQPVGLITAQAIAQPATQMTLRSVHSSGDADLLISTGLEKLNEIVDNSSTIRQKIIEVKFKKGVISQIVDDFLNAFLIITGKQLSVKIDIDNYKLHVTHSSHLHEIHRAILAKPVVKRYATIELNDPIITLSLHEQFGYTELEKLYSYLQKTAIIGPSKICSHTLIRTGDSSKVVFYGINFAYMDKAMKPFARYISNIYCNATVELEKYYGIPYAS